MGSVSHEPGIVDIGGSNLSRSLLTMLQNRMIKPSAPWVLPSPLLSDDKGLALWRDINRLPGYYQTDEEVDLLAAHGTDIAKLIPDGATILDLGCGDIRKVIPLLEKLDRAQKRVKYYGLDLSKPSLETGLALVQGKFSYVECNALWGTFDDALAWSRDISGTRWFLSLGSILGNDFVEPAIRALSRWMSIMRPDDRLLLGMDGTLDKSKIWDSYHDEDGIFERFMRGGLEHSNRVFNERWYRPEDWEVAGVWSEKPLMHRFVFRALRDVSCVPIGLHFSKGDEIDCYEAFKYPPAEMASQFDQCGLKELQRWNSPGSSIYEYLLSSTAAGFV